MSKTPISSTLVYSFSEIMKKNLQKGTKVSMVRPLVIANKEEIVNCLKAGFKLAQIYDAWMEAAFPNNHPFSYSAFRKACINNNLYTPNNLTKPAIDFLPSEILLDSDNNLTPKEQGEGIESSGSSSSSPVQVISQKEELENAG